MAINIERYPVYVRPEHLPQLHALAASLEAKDSQLHALAASLEAKDSPAAPKSSSEEHSEPAETVAANWTADEIRRAYRESPLGMKLIFDGMVDRADEELDAQDLAGFLTHKPQADALVVRGTMGAFANRCLRRYRKPNRSFPFEHRYVNGGFARYRMPAKVADIIRPLRDADAG